jgi:hypothetical protein
MCCNCAGALREDIEDQAAAVEHAAREFLLQVALLAGTQLVIDDDQVGTERSDARAHFLDLAGAHEESWIGGLAGSGHHFKDRRASGARQRGELLYAICLGCTPEPDADQDCTFTATRSVEQLALTLAAHGHIQPAGASSTGGSSSSADRRTLRAGTTVEIACL